MISLRRSLGVFAPDGRCRSQACIKNTHFHIISTMLRILLLCPILLLAAGTAGGQDLRLEWERYYLSQLGPSNDVVEGSTSDSQGNVIVVGTTAIPPLDQGIRIAKYDGDGRLLWETTAGAWPTVETKAIAAGPDGATFVVVKTGSQASDGALVFMKYNAYGHAEWTQQYSDDDVWRDQKISLIARDDGSILAAGSARSSATMEYGFLLKMSSGGDHLWTIRHDFSYSRFEDTAVGADGAVYVAGWSKVRSAYPSAPFVHRYDPDGNVQWSAALRETGVARKLVLTDGGRLFAAGDDQGLFLTEVNPETGEGLRTVHRPDADVLADLEVASDGAAYLAGYDLVPSFCKDECPDDFVTVKFDSVGEWQWTSRYKGIECCSERPTELLVDDQSIYVAGVSNGTAVVSYEAATGSENWVIREKSTGMPSLFSSPSGLTLVQTVWRDGNGADFELFNYDIAGNEQWNVYYDGPRVSSDDARAFAVDAAGNSYVAGIGGFGSTYDCLTVSYDSEGKLRWTDRYG